MRKILLLFIILTNFIFANSSILIVNSYHKGYEWSDSIIKGIEETFYSHSNIDMNILYMDSKRITSQEYYNKLKQLYTIQLKNRKYDLVISVDRFAYDFVLENYNQFFTDERILAVGIENYNENNTKKYDLENKVSALLEKRDLKANVRLIEQMMPTIKKLYIINDKSINATHTEPLIKKLMDDFDEKYQLIYLREDNLSQLVNRFSKFEENSAILFVRFYKNSNGNLNKNQDIAHFIKGSKVPIFITDSIFNKKGALGGKIVDLYKFGQTSGQMALDLLEDQTSTIVISKDLYYVFDSLKLDQFFLSVINLPMPYTIVNKSLTFFDEYRGFIDFVFMISPILLILIIGLAHNIYLRKYAEKKLNDKIEKEKKLEKEREKSRQFIMQQSKLAEIGEIFSSIAHQWKSPLVEITTIAQESFYSSNSTLSENESYVKDIMTQVDYMNDTINDFQDFIVPSNKKKIFDVKEAISSILDIVNHNMKYNYIKINMEVESKTNLHISGFRNEFMQSVLNIINNAKDQLQVNNLKNRYIDIYFYNVNKYLVVKINDNAGGIKMKDIDNIFQPYFSTKTEGHGIGLYMAKMIIEDKMHGKLSVDNIKDGASFTIKLENVE